jgi:hypothetical protein
MLHAVAAGNRPQRGQRFSLRAGLGKRQWRRQPDCRRHGLFDQLLEAARVDTCQHGSDFTGARADVAVKEIVALFEGGERRGRGRGRKGGRHGVFR